MDIFGTLGPSCSQEETLEAMFAEGMTGIRINLSHVKLADCKESVAMVKQAAERVGVSPKILIDMQGPELRIGQLAQPLTLREQDRLVLGADGVPVEPAVLRAAHRKIVEKVR